VPRAIIECTHHRARQSFEFGGDTFIGAVALLASVFRDIVAYVMFAVDTVANGEDLCMVDVRWGVFPYLDESNIGALLPEALTADV
jgi:hypothetical protein